MVNRPIKLKPTKAQEQEFEALLERAGCFWNRAIDTIEADAKQGIFHSHFDMCSQVKGWGARWGLSQQTMQQLLKEVDANFRKYWKRKGGRPKRNTRRNPRRSVPFVQGVAVEGKYVKLPIVGRVKFRHRGGLPEGKIKQARLVKKPRGWYLSLFIDAEPNPYSVGSNPTTRCNAIQNCWSSSQRLFNRTVNQKSSTGAYRIGAGG